MGNQFKIGDVVRLKSGGPKMTVVATRDGGAVVTVAWFPLMDQKPHEYHFAIAALDAVTD